ncbi:acetylcholine receptor subunit beta-type acr-2-like [Haliotis asinina]|uniref:acetylcholine receptor subunit beta-type acr-2-like n=1 Tax=Haliotis asinina TaxID=109174 RepID=UPI0035321916
MAYRKLVYVIFLISAVDLVWCNTSSRLKQQRFRDLLLRGYPKDIPPFPSKSTGDDVKVDVQFLLFHVQDLDVATQVLTVFGALIYRWHDPLLVWNTSSQDNPTDLQLKHTEIWTPSLLLSNNAGSHPGSENALIYGSGDGHVSMTITDLFHTQCTVDVTRYPFDKHQCNIILSSVYDFSFQSCRVYSNPFATYTGKSVEWKVDDKVSRISRVPNAFGMKNVAKIRLNLSREYTFYLLTVITPVSLLSVMNACAFLLPAESGEKISYLISILVTYAVFLNFVIEVLPKSGIPSRLAIYLLLMFCQSCAAILTTLCLLNLYQGADDRMHSSTETTPVGRKSDGTLSCHSSKVSPTGAGVSEAKVSKTKGKNWIKSLERKLFFVFLVFALLSLIPLLV